MCADQIFPYDPESPPMELVECRQCGATFALTAFQDGTLNVDMKKCPKCPTDKE